jgi:translation initiation factor IF-1
MRVARVCGENTYELETADGERALYSLPSRLRHVVFIRPGSYVLALADPVRAARGKLHGDIEAVVLDMHLANLRRHPRWPPRFGGCSGGDHGDEEEGEEEKDEEKEKGMEGEGGSIAPEEDRLGEGEDDASSEESQLDENPNLRKADMFSDSEDEE